MITTVDYACFFQSLWYDFRKTISQRDWKIGGFKVKEYFISEIDIENLYHLSDIKIKLNSTKRQHGQLVLFGVVKQL